MCRCAFAQRPAPSRLVIADELIDSLSAQQLRQALRAVQQVVVHQQHEVLKRKKPNHFWLGF
jgi:Lhr-like helicase